MKWFVKCVKQYADFTGRARRQEYCMFTLFYCIFSIIPILGYVVMLGLLVPCLAVTARRLHDIGKSGWWMLISLVPVVGSIWLFVYTVIEGEPTENQYGPNPKQVEM